MEKEAADIAAIAIPLKEVCRQAKLSEPTIYGLIADGEIRSCKVGSRRYIITKSLHEFFERRAKAAQPRDARVEKMVAARQAKRAERKSRRPRVRLKPKAP